MSREQRSQPALRMFEARDPEDRIIHVSHVERYGYATRGYRCVHCRTQVRYAPPSRSRKDIPDSAVRRAYFGRTSKSEHQDDCRFLLQHALTEWMCDEALAPLIDRGDNDCCLRIDSLSRVLRQPRAPSDSLEDEDTPLARPASLLPRTISRATQLIQLVSRVEAEDFFQVGKTVRLSFNRRSVKWSEFFYPGAGLPSLWHRLQASGNETSHPVGCILTVLYVRPGENWSAKCEPVPLDEKVNIEPWINGSGPRVPRCVQRRAQVAVLCDVSRSSVTNASGIHHNLRFAIDRASQICAVQ